MAAEQKGNVLDELDENKASTAMDALSRVIAAYGVETMRNLVTLRVLVVGLRGVGVEAAKNLILGRPAAVTVCDDSLVRIEDLGANFYARPEHVGKVSLSAACIDSLAELNPYVTVSAHTGALDEEFLKTFGAVVVTSDIGVDELCRINDICRAQKPAISFIVAQTHGVTGTFFTDFGPEHVVTDRDGEPKRSVVIDSIDTHTGWVKCSANHGFDDGDFVKFDDVEGATLLNKAPRVKIFRIYSSYNETDAKTGKTSKRTRQIFNTFRIDLDSLNEELKAAGESTIEKLADLGEYTGGGMVTEVKKRIPMPFRSLRESLTNPVIDPEHLAQGLGVFHPDQNRWLPEMFGGKDLGTQLHFAMLAMLEFQKAKGELPKLHDEADAAEMIKLANDILARHKELGSEKAVQAEKIDEAVVKKFSLLCRVELPGYSAFLGGVAAQEVVKKFGKYTPHYQWMQCDHFELLKDGIPADSKPIGCRYDHQISVFGKAMQDRMGDQKWFLLGCGALGCEYLKGIAMMGIGCGKNGLIHVTDMDRIELSNLSRQFLFRNHHIGRPKSVCGGEVAKTMNPDLNIKTHETKVAPDTEDIFTDAFWDSLTGVWNALDNVQARRYSDSKCLLHSKPLLESGTMGTSANSEIIVPHLTSSYNDHKDQDVGGIAACTLRNFPHLIEHCIEWARPEFDELFELAPQNYNKLVENRDAFFAQVRKEGGAATMRETLEKVKGLHEVAQDRSYEQCIRRAFNHFNAQFRNRILDLTHFFPKDTRVIEKETGADLGPFWSGAKRFPRAAEFDMGDELHFNHLYNTANLYAFMLGVPEVRDRDEFRAKVEALGLTTPEWKKPSRAIDMEGDDSATDSKVEVEEEDDDKVVDELFDFFTKLDPAALKPLRVADFEKDDDTNFHIDFITSVSNLRAWNYQINQASRHQCKIIAGKIIPALATTTAMITGLVELEYYKLLKGDVHLDDLFNANPNLALGTYSWFNPPEAVKHEKHEEVLEDDSWTVVAVPDKFTSWDKVVVDIGDVTVEEFVSRFPSIHHGVDVKMLFKAGKNTEGAVIFQQFVPRNVTMAKQMLARPNLSDAHKKTFQKQVDDAAAAEEKHKAKVQRRLVDVYTDIYGPLPTADRSYLLLAGDFVINGEAAEVPVIKYVFRH